MKTQPVSLAQDPPIKEEELKTNEQSLENMDGDHIAPFVKAKRRERKKTKLSNS